MATVIVAAAGLLVGAVLQGVINLLLATRSQRLQLLAQACGGLIAGIADLRAGVATHNEAFARIARAKGMIAAYGNGRAVGSLPDFVRHG